MAAVQQLIEERQQRAAVMASSARKCRRRRAFERLGLSGVLVIDTPYELNELLRNLHAKLLSIVDRKCRAHPIAAPGASVARMSRRVARMRADSATSGIHPSPRISRSLSSGAYSRDSLAHAATSSEQLISAASFSNIEFDQGQCRESCAESPGREKIALPNAGFL